MSTSRAITTGDRRAGAHLEYVKRRRVLRLGGWHGNIERLETVELPLQTFLERLDIEVQEKAPARWYMLFAGQGRPAGGARDLIGVFESDEKARRAFHELRARPSPPMSWAQLVMLDGRGRTRPVCWFDPNPSVHLLSPEEEREPDHFMGTAASLVVRPGCLPKHSSVGTPTSSTLLASESTHRSAITGGNGLRALSRLLSFRTVKKEASK